MKSKLAFLLLSLLFFATGICIAQNEIIKLDGTSTEASSVYLTASDIVFPNENTNHDISIQKKQCAYILFSNRLRISYFNVEPSAAQPNNYNCTINLVTGSFFIATISRINSDSILYTLPLQKETFVLSTKDVIDIIYTSGLKEHFYSNEKLAHKKKSINRNEQKPIIHNSTSFYLGAVGGLTLSKLSTTDYNYSNYSKYYKKGFLAGIAGYYDFAHNSCFHFELLYSQKGMNIKNDSSKYSLRLNYLELPVSFQFQAGANKTYFFFEPGFYFAHLLSAKATFESNSIDTVYKLNLNGNNHELDRFDFGPVFGIGLKYYLKYGCIVAGARYEFGIVSLGGYTYYDVNGYSIFNSGGLNSSFNFYVGYSICFPEFKQRKNVNPKL